MSLDPTIQQMLAQAPFFDDYTPSKGYQKVLFRPQVAVQARELIQLQDILQNQVSEFADTVYKSGSVVEGCSLQFIPDLEWVMVADTFLTSTSLAQDDPSLTNAIAVGNTTGVQAYIVATKAGFAAQAPGKFFIRYTAPGPNSVTKFIPGEALNMFVANSSYVESVVVQCSSSVSGFSVGSAVLDTQVGNTANVMASALVTNVDTSACTVTINNIQSFFNVGDNLTLQGNTAVVAAISSLKYNTGAKIGAIQVLSSNLTTNTSFSNTDALGYAYGAFVSDGTIYQDGFFINVDAQTVVVNAANSSPSNYSLGFQTTPTIVNQYTDPSLNDNALGYSNYNAPGAWRLKLTANLVSWTPDQLSANASLFPIAQFSNSGVLFEAASPSYSALGDAIAQRTYEEAGHFIVQPFVVASNTDPSNSNNVILNVNPGLAYVEGERIQLLSNLQVTERRGVDTLSSNNRVVTTSYGNYVVVDEVRGFFNPSADTQVLLYDTAQNAVSDGSTTSTALAGSQIGTAYLRAMTSASTLQGTPTSDFNMYLFNINMSDNTKTFSDVKSICTSSGGVQAFADIKSANATIMDAAFTDMLFPLGSVATKTLSSNNVQDTNYYYTATATGGSTYLNTSGKVVFSVPSGGGELGFGVGDATTPELAYITLTMLGNTQSANLSATCNVSANGLIVCSETHFGDSIFYPGSWIGTPGGTFNVTNTINSTAIMTTATGSQSTVACWRMETAGSIVPLDGITRTLTFSNTTSGYANLGLGYQASVNAAVSFYAYSINNGSIGKKINRDTTVLFSTANTGTDVGPWSLGLPDVLQVTAIYPVTGSNSSTYSPQTSNNVINSFVLDDGQRSGFYDLASVKLASVTLANTFANGLYVALVDHFTAVAPGGFFSVDSYPVDDSAAANDASTIATAAIPQFKSTNKTYNLRDCVDFRPYKTATANIGNDISAATLNPSGNSSSFDANTSGFTPYPSGNFICNVTQYLGRKDILLLSSSGSFNIVEGVSSLTPQYPAYDANTNLSIANIVVPPYPSLASNEQFLFPNAPTSYDIQVLLQSHRRYTMSDVGSLDQRITQLEYYTTLNTLENAAATTTVINGNGQQQFQNGIFVDPMNDLSFSDVESSQYTMAIDGVAGIGRPQFQTLFYDLSWSNTESQNIQQTGNFLSIAYANDAYIQQTYASDHTGLTGLPPSYEGSLTLSPNFWMSLEVNGPAAAISSDGSPGTTALAMAAQPPLSLNYGWWRTKGHNTNPASSSAKDPRARTHKPPPGHPSSPSTYSLNDNTTIDTTVQPYISASEVAFIATGLKPLTQFHLYVDNILADLWQRPGTVANGTSSVLGVNSVVSSNSVGTLVTTDSQGKASGKISIPPYTLHAGQHTVTLLDVSAGVVTDPSQNQQVSGASAIFNVSVTYQQPTGIPPAKPISTANGLQAAFISDMHYQFAAVDDPSYPSFLFIDTSKPGPTGSIVSWDWDFGNGTTAHDTSPGASHAVTYTIATGSSQIITVKLKVTDSNGNTAYDAHVYPISRSSPAIPAPTPAPVDNTTPTAVSVSITAINSLNQASASVSSSSNVGVSLTPHISNTSVGTGWSWSISNQTGTSFGGSPPNMWLSSTGANVSGTATVTVTRTGVSANITGSLSASIGVGMSVTPQVAPANTGGSGGCVDIMSFTPLDSKLIGEYTAGSPIQVCRHKDLKVLDRHVSKAYHSLQPCYRLTMLNTKYTVVVSSSTPLEGQNEERFLPQDSLGKPIPTWNGDSNTSPVWDIVERVEYVGERMVNRISVSGQDVCYWAGEHDGQYISTHNVNIGEGKVLTLKKF